MLIHLDERPDDDPPPFCPRCSWPEADHVSGACPPKASMGGIELARWKELAAREADVTVTEWSFAYRSPAFPDGVRYASRDRIGIELHHRVAIAFGWEITQPPTCRRCRRDEIVGRDPPYQPFDDDHEAARAEQEQPEPPVYDINYRLTPAELRWWLTDPSDAIIAHEAARAAAGRGPAEMAPADDSVESY